MKSGNNIRILHQKTESKKYINNLLLGNKRKMKDTLYMGEDQDDDIFNEDHDDTYDDEDDEHSDYDDDD